MKTRFCFVTEADLDRKGVGGVITDQQMLRCLRKSGDVDVIYLKRIRLRSTFLALIVFFFQILKSFSKPYHAYFSRGLITSFFLVSLNSFTLRSRKIVHRALSVPLGSREVRFLRYGRMESLLRHTLFVFLERIVYSRVDIVTVAADMYRRELIKAGVDGEKVCIMNFTAGDEFFDQPLKGDAKPVFRFCYVGGFHRYQDLQPMLEAFETFSKKRKDVELVLVGEGPQRPFLEKEATKRRLRNSLKFAGKISHTSLPDFLSKIDCFVSLTRKPGLSISIVEAAAAGKPIIAFAPKNSLSYSSYFTHKKEIYLVHSVSPEEIADAMTRLYEDSDLRGTLGHGARKVAERYFSQEVAQVQLEQLLRKVT
ncbi:MAG TPA: glycosyltransferase [Candidatus Bathyarchaeia archaeon]|nr:glycosyltransferase [Candidatus Bathyarchaeia archaeon]